MVQRSCKKCEQEREEEEKNIQTKSLVQQKSAGKGRNANAELESSISQARGSGQPMADNVRQPMEEAYGTDFSGVRIHTGSRADNLNKSIQAKAFTTGQDVFFRQGEYSPESSGGKELLAHELTHVVQQSGGSLQRKSAPTQSVKKNKVQTKVGSTPRSNSQIIQPKQIAQKEAEQENQEETEQQAAATTETQSQEQQLQAAPSKNFAADTPTPPTDGGSTGDTSPNDGDGKKLQTKSLLQAKSAGDEKSAETEVQSSSTVKDNKIQAKISSISGSSEQIIQGRFGDIGEHIEQLKKEKEEEEDKSQRPDPEEVISNAEEDPTALLAEMQKGPNPHRAIENYQEGDGTAFLAEMQKGVTEKKPDKIIDKFDDVVATESDDTHDEAVDSSEQALKEHEKKIHERFTNELGKEFSLHMMFHKIPNNILSLNPFSNNDDKLEKNDEEWSIPQEIEDGLNEALTAEYKTEVNETQDWYEEQKEKRFTEPIEKALEDTRDGLEDAENQTDDKIKEKVNEKADELQLDDEAKGEVNAAVEEKLNGNQEEYDSGFWDSVPGQVFKHTPIGAIIGFFTGADKGDKIRQAISEGFNNAKQWLKDKTSNLISSAVKTVSKSLNTFKNIFKGAVNLVGKIVTGKFGDIIQGVKRLYLAAKTVPELFQTAVYEELLGENEDLNEPLSPEFLATVKESGIDIPKPDKEAENEADETQEMPKAPWEGKVDVDEVEKDMELSPELAEEISEKTDGNGTVMLDESDEESRSLDAIISEATEKQEEEATQQMPDDGLTPEQRGEIKFKLIAKSVKDWVSNNRWKIAAGFAAATTTIAGLLLASGGSLAPVIGEVVVTIINEVMSILGILSQLNLVSRAAEYVHDYINQAWDGDIVGGGKLLAKAFAIAFIQLAMWAGSKAAQGAARVVARGAKAAGRLIVKGFKYVIKKGKVIFKGIANTKIGQIVKSIRELGKRLLERMRFKKFRIKVKNWNFKLEGFINPWVVIAEGNIKRDKDGKVAKFDEISQIDPKDLENAVKVTRDEFDQLSNKIGTLPDTKVLKGFKDQRRNKFRDEYTAKAKRVTDTIKSLDIDEDKKSKIKKEMKNSFEKIKNKFAKSKTSNKFEELEILQEGNQEINRIIDENELVPQMFFSQSRAGTSFAGQTQNTPKITNTSNETKTLVKRDGTEINIKPGEEVSIGDVKVKSVAKGLEEGWVNPDKILVKAFKVGDIKKAIQEGRFQNIQKNNMTEKQITKVIKDIEKIKDNDKLIAINNRGLSAHTKAGRRPTKIEIVEPSNNELERIGETGKFQKGGVGKIVTIVSPSQDIALTISHRKETVIDAEDILTSI